MEPQDLSMAVPPRRRSEPGPAQNQYFEHQRDVKEFSPGIEFGFLLPDALQLRSKAFPLHHFAELGSGSPPSPSCQKRICQSKSPVCIMVYPSVLISMPDHDTLAVIFEVERAKFQKNPLDLAYSFGSFNEYGS